MILKKLNARAGTPQLKRSTSQDSLARHEPVLGLPAEPQQDLEELVGEVKAEMELRKRKMSQGKASGGKGGVGFASGVKP